MTDNNREELLLDADSIQRLNRDMAKQIAETVTSDTVAIALMDGAFVFAADILRALNDEGLNLKFDMLRLSSYGDGKSSRGSVDTMMGLARPVRGKPVLILDDIFETGHTLKAACDLMNAAGASKVTTAVFAHKHLPDLKVTEPDYYAWSAPQRFLVGYGLDYRGLYRGQGYISALD